MKKENITQEEYQTIVNKLENIYHKKNILKEQYLEYLLPTIPQDPNKLFPLILFLNKTKNHLTEEMKLEKKKFISTFFPVYLTKEKFILLLEKWINNYVYASQLHTTMQELIIEDPIFFSKHPNFEIFKQNLTTIVQKQEIIETLLKQIHLLLKEEKELLTKKKKYQRIKQKKSSPKKG